MSENPPPNSAVVQIKKPTLVEIQVANPNAFAKPGTMGSAKTAQTGVRVRPLNWRKSRGRKRRPDLRKVKFF